MELSNTNTFAYIIIPCNRKTVKSSLNWTVVISFFPFSFCPLSPALHWSYVFQPDDPNPPGSNWIGHHPSSTQLQLQFTLTHFHVHPLLSPLTKYTTFGFPLSQLDTRPPPIKIEHPPPIAIILQITAAPIILYMATPGDSQSQSHPSRQSGHSISLSCQYSQDTGTHWLVECTLSMAFSSAAIVSPMSLLTIVKSKKWPYAWRSISDSFASRSRLPSYYKSRGGRELIFLFLISSLISSSSASSSSSALVLENINSVLTSAIFWRDGAAMKTT